MNQDRYYCHKCKGKMQYLIDEPGAWWECTQCNSSISERELERKLRSAKKVRAKGNTVGGHLK